MLEVGFGFDEPGVPIRTVKAMAGGGLAALSASGRSGRLSDGRAVGSWDGGEAAPVRQGGSLSPPSGGGGRGKARRLKRRWWSPR
jgi:hypothetical protein